MNTRNELSTDKKIKILRKEIRELEEFGKKAAELIGYSINTRVKIIKREIEKLKKSKSKSV